MKERKSFSSLIFMKNQVSPSYFLVHLINGLVKWLIFGKWVCVVLHKVSGNLKVVHKYC